MNKPLDGLIVLDLSQFVSGPRASQILADMGAEVIKIEPAAGETLRMILMLIPGGERMMSVLNRNKKCVSIDIRSEGGKTVFNKLAAKADILI